MSFDKQKYLAEVTDAAAFIKNKFSASPKTAVILGTGLGGLIDEVEVLDEISYTEIPHFPVSTVQSHAGKLILAKIARKTVLLMQGRFHYYEGYPMHRIVFPVRVFYQLGVRNLLVSNAAGSLNPQFTPGHVMVIDDHINLLGDNPLIGPNLDELGPRFPDMSEPYARDLIATAEDVALQNQICMYKGVYVVVSGPNLETRAEYRFLRAAGGDAVGMSTVPEDIVAVHMGMRVLAFSVITDSCLPDALKPVNLEEIIAMAGKTEPQLTTLMKGVIARI